MKCNLYLTAFSKLISISFELGYRDPLVPSEDSSEFDDDEDGTAIVGTILFKTTDSLLRVRIPL